MGYYDEPNWDLHYIIEDLVETGNLEIGSIGYGIAQRVIQSASLTLNQRRYYDNNVEPLVVARSEEHEMTQRMNSWPE
jgi:hypothetical protein